MLECLVLGRRAAQDINAALDAGEKANPPVIPALPARERKNVDFDALRAKVKDLMSRHGYVIRNEKGMKTALKGVEEVLAELEQTFDESTDYLETLNIATVARAILIAALARKESIGSHYREDAP